MDGCIRETKVRIRDLGARLNVRDVEQPLVAGLYADDTVPSIHILTPAPTWELPMPWPRTADNHPLSCVGNYLSSWTPTQ